MEKSNEKQMKLILIIHLTQCIQIQNTLSTPNQIFKKINYIYIYIYHQVFKFQSKQLQHISIQTNHVLSAQKSHIAGQHRTKADVCQLFL